MWVPHTMANPCCGSCQSMSHHWSQKCLKTGQSTHQTLVTVLDSLVFLQHLCLPAGPLKHRGVKVIRHQIGKKVLIPIQCSASQEDHCKFHFFVYLIYLIKSLSPCKAFMSEDVSVCMGGMGRFATGLEKQWELENCCFYSPKATSSKCMQVSTAKYEYITPGNGGQVSAG